MPKRKEPVQVSMQDEIRARANLSLAILGMAFVHRGSGRFLNLKPSSSFVRFGKGRNTT